MTKPLQTVWLVMSKTPRARIWRPVSCHLRRSTASKEFYARLKADPYNHHAIRRAEIRP